LVLSDRFLRFDRFEFFTFVLFLFACVLGVSDDFLVAADLESFGAYSSNFLLCASSGKKKKLLRLVGCNQQLVHRYQRTS
jgi:hypothetical protein